MSLPGYAMNLSNFPEMYERWLVPVLFQPWAERLLQQVPVLPGQRVLDVACGTGIVARLAKQRAGTDGIVVGVDLSAPMLATARRLAPDIDWREGNATALPLGHGERFDIVLCNQGVQFFPDRLVALTGMRDALKGDGRIGLAIWRPLAEAPVFRELNEVGERHLGAIVDTRFGFGETAPVERLLTEAGFADIRIANLSQTVRFEDPAILPLMNAMALVGMSSAGKAMSEEERSRIAAVIATEGQDAIRGYLQDGALVFETASNIATARA